jgi:hypothetical protein
MPTKSWLTARWFRYLAIPIAAGLPSGVAALWFALHQNATTPYLLKGHQPLVFAATAAWAGGFSMLKSYLDDIARNAIETLRLAQEELMHLLGFVRIVVGSKSRRFHESLSSLPSTFGPAETFLAITRPDLQIKQLVQAIHGYFTIRVNPNNERVKISLMKWNDQKGHLEYVEWYPDVDHPRSKEEHFTDASTVAGLAYFNEQLVILENVWSDARYKRLEDTEAGSMFAYPVVDDRRDKPVFIANVFSTRIGRFTVADAPAIRITMDVFAERLILENRLAEIKEKAISNANANREKGATL